MIICVERGKHSEFDRLWAFAKASLLINKPGDPKNGYFNSACETPSADTPCLDPFGHEQFITALLFARGRWGNMGKHNYEADAQALLSVMRNKEAENGGIVDGVTNMFDDTTKLLFDLPDESVGQSTRPSIVMPAYYELWAQATGDDFFRQAAQAGREYWKVAVHTSNGLIPMRSHFDGSPIMGSNYFGPEAYRTQLNMTLDQIWFGSEPWEVEEADRLLTFFVGEGINSYGQIYGIESGSCMNNCAREQGLVSMNGVSALIATHAQRTAFIQMVWDQAPLSGAPRYYSGLLHLLALITLSGQYRVY
jgi:oligosaccharide reducing-end xylanase